jgi:LmbE family N-acetylglucosaminyl deacetylase
VVTSAANRIDAAPGTAETAWQRWLTSLQPPRLDVTRWSSAVIVAAHPDDEVLGAGGILALLAGTGARIRLVAVTDGERSDPAADPVALARTRVAESAIALGLLGAQRADVVRLRLPDTGVADAEAELAERLAGLCRGFEVCLAPWENDAHADHEAAGRAARRIHDHVLSYPVWMWHWAAPADPDVPWERAVSVPLPAAAVTRKAAAIGAFHSQLTSRAGLPGPILPAGFVAHFTRPQEVLFR